MRLAHVSVETQLAFERLLAEEAWLLDERRFSEWLDLFTEDARYSIWVREASQHRGEEGVVPHAEPRLPVVEDDKRFLTMRVRRLETRLAHAEQPPSFTRHLVSNVLVDDATSEPGVHVRSSFIV